jgi:hypothetical protein
MASNCAVGICRRSNTQFSAEETPSGSLSFVRHVSTTSVHGTERTCRSGRDMSAIGARADVICSERVFRLLTPSGRRTAETALLRIRHGFLYEIKFLVGSAKLG